MESKEIDKLNEIFDDLKFLNSKQKKMIIDSLIKNKEKSITNLNEIRKLIEKINECKFCTSYCLNETVCDVCKSNTRSQKLLIVESREQIKKIEENNLFDGKYFVIPILYTKKFQKINYDFSKLLMYLKHFDEIIIGVNYTQEGILTTNLIYDEIRNFNNKIKITKLSVGLPFGTNIDYVDQFTLSYAIKNRKDVE